MCVCVCVCVCVYVCGGGGGVIKKRGTGESVHIGNFVK